jgi:LmbE family N-acetylglucosaminyl deacetylase
MAMGVMLAVEFLEALERLPLIGFDTLGLKGLVVIAPHPDDETLGCGGLIAAARRRGVPVRIVVLTDGIGSHPNSPSFPPSRLRRLREDEVRAAAEELGVPSERVACVGLPDRFLATTGAQAAIAIETIRAAANCIDATMVTVTSALDPHADHIAAFDLACSACRQLPGVQLYAYPIWALGIPAQEPLATARPKGFRLSIEQELPAKRRAIQCHRSQVTPFNDDDPEGFMLSSSELARFERSFETFIETVR